MKFYQRSLSPSFLAVLLLSVMVLYASSGVFKLEAALGVSQSQGLVSLGGMDSKALIALDKKGYCGLEGLGDCNGPIRNVDIDPVPPQQAAFPPGSVGAGKVWTKTGRLKDAQLPREGRIRFVPSDNWDGSTPIPRGPNKGFLDKFGNEWTKGPSRTVGQPFEWDVQLSSRGRQQIGWTTRDGSHANVSLDGRITHK